MGLQKKYCFQYLFLNVCVFWMIVMELQKRERLSVNVFYKHLSQATKQDILNSAEAFKSYCTAETMMERAINLLQMQKDYNGGSYLDLYEHGLQTATRAYKDGADEELIVASLLHDVGETISPCNHGEIAASLLRPYITPKTWWILQHHEIFQGYYYFDVIGQDKNKRNIFIDNEHYSATVDFCHKWDAPSFDPEYHNLSINIFKPMIKRIFSRKAFLFWDGDPKSVVMGMEMETKDTK